MLALGRRACREEILHSSFPPSGGIWSSIDLGDLQSEPPCVTFEDRLTVWIDDLRVKLHVVPTPAHTSNDVVVWIPDRSVLSSASGPQPERAPCGLSHNQGVVLWRELHTSQASQVIGGRSERCIAAQHHVVCAEEVQRGSDRHRRLTRGVGIELAKILGWWPLQAAGRVRVFKGLRLQLQPGSIHPAAHAGKIPPLWWRYNRKRA